MTDDSEPKATSTGEKVDGALSLFGKIQIWLGIVVGSIVVVVAAAFFVASFFLDRDFTRIDAQVDSVTCSNPTKVTHCVSQKEDRVCTTTEEMSCSVRVHYKVDGNRHDAAIKESFKESFEPKKGDMLSVYVNSAEPSIVKTPGDVVTPKQRVLIRIVSAIVFVVALLAVVFNFLLRRNRNWQRIQGTFGAIDAVGGMFGSR